MALSIDAKLIGRLGLFGISNHHSAIIQRAIYYALENRVGTRISALLSAQQLSEFEKFIDAKDEAGALAWLEAELPQYKVITASEFELVKRLVEQDSSLLRFLLA